MDFNVDDDGSTWSGSADEGYTLDPDDSRADYFPVENGAGGWLPIGDETRTFVAVFDGNGNSIRNLAIRRDQTLVGLFGAIGGGAAIRNLGLVDNLVDSTGSSSETFGIGGLVGVQFTSSITASYATGPAAGGDGGSDAVGGLVGTQAGDALITASYATGAVSGGDGNEDIVGGLVGFQFGGSITASYATGAVSGGDGNEDIVGGLMGFQFGGSITASYATGAADGGDGNGDRVGGLVGFQFGSSITASYGFGSVTGELVGELGGVVIGGSDGSTKPEGVSTAAQLTEANAGSSWNNAGSNTLGAWDFGTETQIPALNYDDYDGGGDVFDCGPDPGDFPADACGTLLPGQADARVGPGLGDGGTPEPSGPEPSGPEPSGPEPSGPEPSGPEPSGPEPSGPEPSGPEGSDDGGGGGSLGPWALAALVLPLLLGWRRRRRGFGSCFINQGGAQPCSFSGRLRHLLARSMRSGGGRLRPRQKTALARRAAGNDTSPRARLKGAPLALESALARPPRRALGNDGSSFLLASGK